MIQSKDIVHELLSIMTYRRAFSFLLFISCGGVVYLADTCCPDGWVSFKGSCYLFADTPGVHFTEAEHYCLQHGSDLVTVETSEENAFLKDFLSDLKGAYYWMGLTDDMVEGIWRWKSNGLQATFSDWSPNEPNNFDGIEDCACFRMSHGGQWNDISCTHNFIPVCEKRYVC